MTAPVVPRKEAKGIRDSVIDLLDVIDENIESGYDGHCLNLRIVGGIIELALRAAEAAERERCAKVVERVAAEQRSMALEKWGDAPASAMSHDEAASAGPRYAAAIRAMGDE